MVPIIDFRSSTVEKQMHAAYTTCGFAVFTNVFDSWLSEFLNWQQLVEEFFNLSYVKKIKYLSSGVADNLGYSRRTDTFRQNSVFNHNGFIPQLSENGNSG